MIPLIFLGRKNLDEINSDWLESCPGCYSFYESSLRLGRTGCLTLPGSLGEPPPKPKHVTFRPVNGIHKDTKTPLIGPDTRPNSANVYEKAELLSLSFHIDSDVDNNRRGEERQQRRDG